MRRTWFAAVVALAFSSAAHAGGVVYQPVTVQHDGFAYSGRNPAVIAYANRVVALKRLAVLRDMIVVLPSGRIVRPADAIDSGPAVYSDRVPYVDLSPLGYTASDAANEQGASLPRYIRKADLLARVRVGADGTLTSDLRDAASPSSVGSDDEPDAAATGPATDSVRGKAVMPAMASGEIRISPARARFASR